jgi:uncharacterized protein YdhG (YjbR/CyaY superfamily)
MSKGSAAIDEYIASFPADVQVVLRSVRATIRQAAPEAEERISYRVPAVFQSGVVVYFGAFKNHLGLFPPVDDPEIRARVAAYAGPKGNLRFPLDRPLPHELIAAVVGARLESNLAKAPSKRSAGGSSPAKRTTGSRRDD